MFSGDGRQEDEGLSFICDLGEMEFVGVKGVFSVRLMDLI